MVTSSHGGVNAVHGITGLAVYVRVCREASVRQIPSASAISLTVAAAPAPWR